MIQALAFMPWVGVLAPSGCAGAMGRVGPKPNLLHHAFIGSPLNYMPT